MFFIRQGELSMRHCDVQHCRAPVFRHLRGCDHRALSFCHYVTDLILFLCGSPSLPWLVFNRLFSQSLVTSWHCDRCGRSSRCFLASCLLFHDGKLQCCQRVPAVFNKFERGLLYFSFIARLYCGMHLSAVAHFPSQVPALFVL